MKKYISLIGINIGILSILFFFAEVISRIMYPELANSFHSENITGGKVMHSSQLNGISLDRTSIDFNNIKNNDGKKLLVIGDSVTSGFSLGYEDIYWVKLQNKINLFSKEKLSVLAISNYGRDFRYSTDDYINKIKKLSTSNNVKYLLYQFNQNDITPLRKDSDSIKKINNKFKVIARFSYKYLSRSVFLRRAYLLMQRLSSMGNNCNSGLKSLGSYTWTLGSKNYVNESKENWYLFEEKLEKFNNAMKKEEIKFMIFISPILYDIDKRGIHPYYNNKNLDFSCSTINPRKTLKEIAKNNQIIYIDPTNYIRNKFEERVLDKNFEPFYFPGDDNHFNQIVSEYLSDYLYSEIFKYL